MNKWIKLTIVISTFALISCALYIICKSIGIANIDNLKAFIEQRSQFAVPCFILIEICLVTLFCFVPLLNSALVMLGCVLFGPYIGFLASWLACFASSLLLFTIGDKFGEAFACKLIGKDELEKTQNMLDTKSKILLPIFLAIPGMPDDAICLVAGITKMKYWYFSLVCFIFEGIDVAVVCFFSSGLIAWQALTAFEWIVLANLLIIDVYLVVKLQNFFENKKKDKN